MNKTEQFHAPDGDKLGSADAARLLAPLVMNSVTIVPTS